MTIKFMLLLPYPALYRLIFVLYLLIELSSMFITVFDIVITEVICIHNEIEYGLGDVIQTNCTTRCTCQLDSSLDCQTQQCLLDGPTCFAWGDPHYGSFDSRTFDFQGDCEYVLTQPCNSSEFIIVGVNSPFPFNPSVSVTEAVRVIIPNRGLEVLLSTGGSITINAALQPNNGDGIVHRSSGVEITRTGGNPYVLLTIGAPIAILWDGLYRVDISVSSGWQGRLCGLCGSYNNDPSDDFMLPDGSVTPSVDEFGSSWLYANTSSTCGVPQPSPPCPASLMAEAQSRCNELMNSVFTVCNSVVDPGAFIDGCIFDYCLCSESIREDCYCDSLAVYAATCASNGIIIPNWRNSFCRELICTSTITIIMYYLG